MNGKIWEWLKAGTGPNLPTFRARYSEGKWAFWKEPGRQISRGWILLGLLSWAAVLLAGCSPEPERVVCWERSTNKAVGAHVMLSRWETIYVYRDDNGLEQRITPKNSHLWRCVRQGDGT